MNHQKEVTGHLNGHFCGKGFLLSGQFSARAGAGAILLLDGSQSEICRSPLIELSPMKGATFSLHGVVIGNRFHWERKEDQAFHGDLTLLRRQDGTIAVINRIPAENYLVSVISSEMNASAPFEFLKAHAILSRSWLLAALERKNRPGLAISSIRKATDSAARQIRWYEREDHDLFDVCNDDHCQRYHGITKAPAGQAREAVRQTQGTVMTYQGEICDARYSKACGGITEEFSTAWEDREVPYLKSIPDASAAHPPARTEERASTWILSEPEAYCNTGDMDLLERILPSYDRETESFFRWKVQYSREELAEILWQKSGFDFGTLKAIVPLHRGPSGRISRLKIVGSNKSMVVGKELEIRRWLSRSHLYSSAFIVFAQGKRFTFHGAGWGHGVGLCQVGAAAMANAGFSAEQILGHYFQGVALKKIY